jgi:hypothetical protein
MKRLSLSPVIRTGLALKAAPYLTDRVAMTLSSINRRLCMVTGGYKECLHPPIAAIFVQRFDPDQLCIYPFGKGSRYLLGVTLPGKICDTDDHERHLHGIIGSLNKKDEVRRVRPSGSYCSPGSKERV